MRNVCIQIAQAVKNAGGSISLDPNLRPELLSLEEYRTILQPVVAMSDILLPSGDELTLLTGEKDTEQACRRLLLSNVKIIVLKLGVRGCRIYTRDNIFEVPGFKIKAIDPTGAGDCFDAGFISAYLDGLPLQLAASFANALGALGTTRRGAMEGTFSLKEVMAFIRCHSE
jgi:sugar/nucleoside kinase (ribokinase family)